MQNLLRIFLFVALSIFAQGEAFAQANCRVSTAAPTYVDGQVAPLSCDTTGALRSGGGAATVTANQGTAGASNWLVTGAGGTFPVTQSTSPWVVSNGGTFAVQAAQSGTWTVQPGNTANTTPWAFNQTQLNGVAFLAGNGATGTGSPRVTLANDTSAIAGWGLGAINSAAPSGAQMSGVRSGANMVGLTQANGSVPISVTTATTTQLVGLVASSVIHVTSFDVIAAGTGNIQFVYGTGSNCGTGTAGLTGNYNLTAQAGIAKGSGIGPVLVVPAGNALCVITSAAVGMYGSVSYTQFVP